jgi:hypothetical protein
MGPQPFQLFYNNLSTNNKMHLAYSAIKPESDNGRTRMEKPVGEALLRYLAYLETCEKYSDQIAAIRKYFPGWAPQFRQ